MENGEESWRRRAGRVVRWTLKKALWLVGFVLALLLVLAFLSRKGPDLESWHHAALESEFRWWKPGAPEDLEGYLALEAELFGELDRLVRYEVESTPANATNRYLRGGLADPANHAPGWNRSTVLAPEGEPRGGVLLLHGLTDSPYSMRTIAELYRSRGWYALALRLPGHGTIPGELAVSTWRDWRAAANLGLDHVCGVVGERGPVHVVGYSMGGALTVLQTLERMDEGERVPDRLVLVSPAMGVSSLAWLADVHRVWSWIPYFEKSRWLSIGHEYDPFKYNSFPKNGGEQMFRLTRRMERELASAAEAGRMETFPPTLVLQSLVDATVNTGAVVTRLMHRTRTPESELVLFDVNRQPVLEPFLHATDVQLMDRLESAETLPFGLTLIVNGEEDEVVARRRAAGEREVRVEPLGLSWPRRFFSLSHVALPFPPDDPLYGALPMEPDAYRLGGVAVRGERGLFTVSIETLMRLRHNPFHPWVEERLGAWIEGR
jgi:alpha-beta hydrolase superfamily lysophospholipase